jgi:hypothetical protein
MGGPRTRMPSSKKQSSATFIASPCSELQSLFQRSRIPSMTKLRTKLADCRRLGSWLLVCPFAPLRHVGVEALNMRV